jgi:hypothetical protein
MLNIEPTDISLGNRCSKTKIVFGLKQWHKNVFYKTAILFITLANDYYAQRLTFLIMRERGNFKGSLTRDFRLQVFFMNQCPLGPQVFHWSHFEFFRKFAEIFANYCLSPVSTTTVINCSAVSTTQAKNLLPVSLTPAINLCHGFSVIACVVDTGEQFIAGDNDTGDNFIAGDNDIHSRISPRIFEKIRNGPNRTLRGPGDTDL